MNGPYGDGNQVGFSLLRAQLLLHILFADFQMLTTYYPVLTTYYLKWSNFSGMDQLRSCHSGWWRNRSDPLRFNIDGSRSGDNFRKAS